MIYESFIISFFLALLLKLREAWYESRTFNILQNTAKGLKQLFSYSCIYNFFKREGFISRNWEHSTVYRLVNLLVNLPSNILRRGYMRFEDVFSESFFWKAVSAVLSRLEVIIGLTVIIILATRHEQWDNIYSLIIALFLTAAFFIKTVINKDEMFNIKRLDVTLLFFFLAVIVAGAGSISPSESLRFLFFYITCFLMVLVIVSSVNSAESLRVMINVILVGVFFIGLYGVWQSIIGVPVDPSLTDVNLNEGMPGRIYSTVDNPNNFAEILVLTLPFFAAAMLNARKTLMKVIFALMALPPLISLAFTGSRSGWIAFACAVFVFLFFKKRVLIPLFILLGAASFPFLPDFVVRRAMTILNAANDTSVMYRFEIYQTFVPMFRDYWVSGIGLGTDIFMKVIEGYYSFTKKTPLHTHNLYLQVWIEAGIVAAVAFLWFIIRTIKKSMICIYKTTDRGLRNILAAGISSLAGIMIIGMVEYVWYYPRIMLVFWIVVGILLAAVGLVGKQEDNI